MDREGWEDRAVVERWFELRAAALILASLSMLLAISMPAVAAQAPGGGVPGGSDPATQPEPVQVAPAGLPVSTPAEPLADPPSEAPLEPSVGPPAGVPGNCDHAAGEFLVGYVSEEALGAAPQGNVVETFDGILAQHLIFEYIKNIADPAARLAAEEAKRQELAAQPGVAYAEYNCIAGVDQAAAMDGGASIPLPTRPASCGDCGRSVVEGARKIISEGFQGAGSKDAFDAALLAARTDDDEDNVAFASELELDEEGSAEDQYIDAAGSSSNDSSTASDSETGDADSDATTEDDTESSEGGSDAKSGVEEESGSGAGETGTDAESSDDEDVVGAGDTSSEDAAAEPGEGGDTGVAGASESRPVSGKNAAASEEPAVVSGPRVLALVAGGLLLAAGVFVGRRILGA